MRRLFTSSVARLLAGLCAGLVQTAAAQLTPLNDDELALSTGQALIKMEEFNDVAQSSGGTLDFTRITLGTTAKINANIESLVLGRYYRPNPDANSCTDGGRQCNDTAQEWSCSNGECGGLDGTFKWPQLVNGEKDYQFSELPAGFEKVSDADIVLRNLSFGYVGENGEIVPFVMEDPYFEFAFDDTGNMVGLRLGYGKASGVMGNTIDVISGNIQPRVAVTVKGLSNLTADVKLDFSGVRTPGYINNDDAKILGLSLKDLSPEAQLRPVESLLVTDAKDMFLSINSQAIDYPEISDGVLAPTAMPGFWLNMEDGINGATAKFKHPDNYLEGHPLYQQLVEAGWAENYFEN